MGSDEKDRFGTKLRDAERAREDQYFAEQDRRLMEEFRKKQVGEQKAGEMVCPRCGTGLQNAVEYGVSVEQCPGCGGVWLDRGELERLAEQETDGWIARWIRREFEKPVI